MNWSDLLAACALFLVIEGIMPFLSPSTMRRYMRMASQISDTSARVMGFVSIGLGLVLLYVVRH